MGSSSKKKKEKKKDFQVLLPLFLTTDIWKKKEKKNSNSSLHTTETKIQSRQSPPQARKPHRHQLQIESHHPRPTILTQLGPLSLIPVHPPPLPSNLPLRLPTQRFSRLSHHRHKFPPRPHPSPTTRQHYPTETPPTHPRRK